MQKSLRPLKKVYEIIFTVFFKYTFIPLTFPLTKCDKIKTSAFKYT